MDSQQFREFGKAAVNYIADYIDTIRDRSVYHNVEPGYLDELIPKDVPEKGEHWQEIFKDIDKIIMPGITHWHSPHFHSFCPIGQSFPAVVGEIFSAGFATLGVTWEASPAITELEVAMMNWLGRLIHLPEEFLNTSKTGGGVIQNSGSDSILICLLAAKEKAIKSLKLLHPELEENDTRGKLMAYTSMDSNSCVEKAGLLGSISMRLLPTDTKGCLRGSTLRDAIEGDKSQGLYPCYVVSTLGTTPTCAFDNLVEIGSICKEENIWLHIDGAYAGAALACPEYRYLGEGIEHADSFNFNPHKWLLVNFDCSALWLKHAKYLNEPFRVDRTYLKTKDNCLPNYRDWQISAERRFRALKLWFVLRSYGVEGIQKHIRLHVSLAKYFEILVSKDERFEIIASSLGLVCFRLKGNDEYTKILLEKLRESRKIFVMGGYSRGRFFIRFFVCSRLVERRDMDFAWEEIVTKTDDFVPRSEKDKSLLPENNFIFINKCEYTAHKLLNNL